MKMKNLFFIVAIILMLLPFGFVGAQVNQPNPGQTIGNPIKTDNISEFIDAILNLVVDIGGPIVAFFLLISGFLFVTARGNPEKINTAKTTFFWTIIGAVIVLGALVISETISGTIEQIKEGTSL